jgi:hypothetical protein
MGAGVADTLNSATRAERVRVVNFMLNVGYVVSEGVCLSGIRW